MSDNFPKTASDFLELREYLNFLQDELSKADPNSISQDELNSYANLLLAIENSLTLAELDRTDDVQHVRDAQNELSKIFGKTIF